MMNVKSSDFDTMRDYYEEYLQSKNFDTPYIKEFLAEFDDARAREDYEWILSKMDKIGVYVA